MATAFAETTQQPQSRPAREPERRCLVTRARHPARRMLRFVAGPDGTIVPDVAGTLPGRGLWLTAARDIVERARLKGRFAKAAGMPVAVDEHLADRVEGLLARRCLEQIGLARRAGAAVAGHGKVRAMLAAGDAGLLLLASDGSPEGVARMRSAGTGIAVVDLFTGDELGRVFGRDNTVFAAIAKGAFAARLADEAHRLAGFRRGATEGK